MIDDYYERSRYLFQVLSAIHSETVKEMEVYECDRPRQKLGYSKEYHMLEYGKCYIKRLPVYRNKQWNRET